MFITGIRGTRMESNVTLVDKGAYILAIGMIISAASNLALTLLAAGRIWWIARGVRSSKTHVLTAVNKIILESGMLYPLTMIVHLSITNAFPDYQIPLDTLNLVVLAAGIAPTLIIVRLRLGVSFSGDGSVTQPPHSSLFLHSILQPTQRSSYFSRLSTVPTVGRHTSVIEGDHVKPLPRAFQAVNVV
ncbi:hypothetical protein E1B28_009144 [Marasmius oreades]|uniref:Uncharacterized protein n=1 Tax=Marasmius oreades TaxID=181124 RepID=A0A9P7RZS9_9AGAR|nr:uncharacterized protein E1B28_009144 [Marasmius oreades]KAG7092829.1 hypothetical protein E1B28_009144 [Marasmius oreades]